MKRPEDQTDMGGLRESFLTEERKELESDQESLPDDRVGIIKRSILCEEFLSVSGLSKNLQSRTGWSGEIITDQ